jgi:hypothetical protein
VKGPLSEAPLANVSFTSCVRRPARRRFPEYFRTLIIAQFGFSADADRSPPRRRIRIGAAHTVHFDATRAIPQPPSTCGARRTVPDRRRSRIA